MQPPHSSAKARDGDAPLHEAAPGNNPGEVKRLLDEGADIHAKDRHNQTPMHATAFANALEAAQKNAAEVAKALIDNGATK